MNLRHRAVLFLISLALGICPLLACAASRAQTVTQKQATPHQTPHESATSSAKKQTFGFAVRSVELETLPDGRTGPWYLVEGTTINGWRFALSCPDHPPASTAKYYTVEEQAERDNEYKNIEQFRKLASSLTFSASLKKEAGLEIMTLYILLLHRADEAELTKRAAQGDEAANKIIESLGERRRKLSETEPGNFTEALAECTVINRIPNALEMFSLRILSSESRIWKDGQGYEVEAQTEDELLTLGCTEGKGQACHSLPPKAYRAIRRQSQRGDLVGLYDADLNPVAIYRILSERSAK